MQNPFRYSIVALIMTCFIGLPVAWAQETPGVCVNCYPGGEAFSNEPPQAPRRSRGRVEKPRQESAERETPRRAQSRRSRPSGPDQSAQRDQYGSQDQYGGQNSGNQGNTGDSGAGAAPAQGSGFSAAGSAGGSSLSGALGASPTYELKKVGINNGAMYNGRFKLADFMDRFSLYTDYYAGRFKGSGQLGQYRFEGDLWFGNMYLARKVYDMAGDTQDTQANIDVFSITGDADCAPLFSPIKYGIRLNFSNYSEYFNVKRSSSTMLFGDKSRSQYKNYNMFGVGGFGALDLSSILGVYGLGGCVIIPSVQGGGMLGYGNEMKFGQWEAFLKLQVAQVPMGWYLPLPTSPSVVFEIGYSHWGFKETKNEPATTKPLLISSHGHQGVGPGGEPILWFWVSETTSVGIPNKNSDISWANVFARVNLLF
jgi:hypothetical protein